MGGGSVAMAVVLVVVLAAAGVVMVQGSAAVSSSWCIARSGTTDKMLQTGLDYACGAGADCAPIHLGGSCFLPNTVQGHASYAYNSYYQKAGYASGACDFSGTATLTISDPSYGTCKYPSSISSTGGGGEMQPPPSLPSTLPPVTTFPPPITNVPTNNPATIPLNGTNSPMIGDNGTGGGGIGLLPPSFGPSSMDMASGHRRVLTSHLVHLLWLLPLLM